MCGILGCALVGREGIQRRDVDSALRKLFLLSESRGKEASGLAVRAEQAIYVHREARSAHALVTTSAYAEIAGRFLDSAFRAEGEAPALIGHARLTTNGLQGISTNNQPVVCEQTIGVHNGIIVNVDQLWARHAGLPHHYEVDTEILLRLMDREIESGAAVADAARNAFEEIAGAASVAVLFREIPQLLLATNTGSLYTLEDPTSSVLFFASEAAILRRLQQVPAVSRIMASSLVEQVAAGSGLLVDLSRPSLHAERFSLQARDVKRPVGRGRRLALIDTLEEEAAARAGLGRCTKCVLPETFPHISFDEDGVCNYCREYTPRVHKGHDALVEAVEPFRSKDGRADCLVAFSGGRDSTYSLHYVKNELGLNPIAYTYDWGMVNALARRNQSRVTSKLGVEQLLISADIKRKRKNIGKNVRAWLSRPELGMVPLFMAGDKQFFYYANKLREQTGIQLFIWAENQLERTNFKAGFCGISSPNSKQRIYRLSVLNKARILSYYASQYLLNPGYINTSIFDTLFAYASYYLIEHDYLWFYDYIPWDEAIINRTLHEVYDWETDPGTTTTWRIGDETAAFYNYIYYSIAGFCENDTFRSNQIREGLLTRGEALRLIAEENKPRYGSIQSYLSLINVDFDEAMSAIHSARRLFHTRQPS